MRRARPASLTAAALAAAVLGGLSSTSYYLDDATPAGGVETQCTGDAAAYGASGPLVEQALPNTDPTRGAANRFAATRSIFYDAPGEADGARRKAHVDRPLQAATSPWP
jgi:hypothetical protein